MTRGHELVEPFITTLEQQGASVLIQGDIHIRPARIHITSVDGSTDCLLNLWNVTPGGNHRPEDERRIQITGAKKFAIEPGVRTIIGGYYAEEDVWAFWDARRHSTFSDKSPSFQTKIGVLLAAAHRGVATQFRPVKDARGEVVVAVARDSLLWYVQKGEALHNADEDADDIGDLIDAPPEDEREFIDGSSDDMTATRRVELVETLRAYRSAKFRPQVMRAYRFRCAVCGTALKLVDAAHIVPISHPRGTDEVNNGLALCRLHHAAYDIGLIGVQSTHHIVLNDQAVRRLTEAQLDAGLDVFRAALPECINTPASIEVRPKPEYLRIGLEARQFPPTLIR